MSARWLPAVAVSVFGTVVLAGQQAVFRSSTDVVTVDVAVYDRNRPVAGLTAADFVVRDNGVIQDVQMLPSASLPIDLTLALDSSGSMAQTIETVKREVEGAATSLLAADDRLRLLTFAWDAQEAFAMQPATSPLTFDRYQAGGGTSLFDALASVLMRRRAAGRGEIAIVLTDGADSSSAMTAAAVQQLARMSDVLLYVYRVRTPIEVAVEARRGRLPATALDAIAGTTGGHVELLLAGRQISDALTKTIGEFRARYTLTYTLTGVAREGWHEISIAVNRPGRHEVRARKGYFGG